MKLIVLKQSSGDPLPVGTVFEIPDDDQASADALIAGGYAKAHVEEPEPASASRRTYRRRDLRAEDES